MTRSRCPGAAPVLWAICSVTLISACECGSLESARQVFCAQRPDVCDGSTSSGGDGGADGATDGGADAGTDAGGDAGFGQISGTVTNLANQQLLQGASVMWNDAGSTTTDSNGAYALVGVPTGTGIVVSSHANGYLHRYYTVDVVGGMTTVLNIQLSTSAKLIGDVSFTDAGPVVGALVRVQGGQLPRDQTVATDGLGHYDEGYIPVGDYVVTCSTSDGGEAQTADASVVSGFITTVNFTLP